MNFILFVRILEPGVPETWLRGNRSGWQRDSALKCPILANGIGRIFRQGIDNRHHQEIVIPMSEKGMLMSPKLMAKSRVENLRLRRIFPKYISL